MEAHFVANKNTGGSMGVGGGIPEWGAGCEFTGAEYGHDGGPLRGVREARLDGAQRSLKLDDGHEQQQR